ncbi:MAG: Fur family transcriptional regulator [Anaerolineae bacterium]
MADPEQRFQQLQQKFRNLGYRLTPQRLALLRLIAESQGHPSAKDLFDEIRAQYPTTSLATIYKTLNILKELDEVLELGFSDDDNRYDGNKPYPHPHIICIRCRKIVDFDRDVITDLESQLAAASGFEIVSHRLDFYGLCPECRANL